MRLQTSTVPFHLSLLGIKFEQWETPVSEWRDFALKHWKDGIGRVQQCDFPDFREEARLHFMHSRIPTCRIRTWLNVMLPEEGGGYSDGYPHVHHNEDGKTIVHYLDVPPGSGALHIIHDGKVHVLEPTTGSAIYIPNGVEHGVLKNNADRPRVALIATAYSK